MKVVKALDITFTDKDGNEIEPKERVSVNFENSAFGKISDPKIYHIEDNGIAEKLADSKVGTYGDQVSISAKDFSIYVVVETGEDARVLVKFMNGNSPIQSMLVKKNDASKH